MKRFCKIHKPEPQSNLHALLHCCYKHAQNGISWNSFETCWNVAEIQHTNSICNAPGSRSLPKCRPHGLHHGWPDGSALWAVTNGAAATRLPFGRHQWCTWALSELCTELSTDERPHHSALRSKRIVPWRQHPFDANKVCTVYEVLQKPKVKKIFKTGHIKPNERLGEEPKRG